MTTETFNGSDFVFITMALQDAADKYRASAANLRRLEVFRGQFFNAIKGQEEMEATFLELLDKARANLGSETAAELVR